MNYEQVFETLPQGWLSLEEGRLLLATAMTTHPDSDILEVGCFHGRSTVLLASTGRVIHAVDPFFKVCERDLDGDEMNGIFHWNLHSRKITNVIHHRVDVADFEARPVGFAYLDGDHSPGGTRMQIIKAIQCNPQYIAIHDVNDSGGGLAVKKEAISLLGKWITRVERMAVWKNLYQPWVVES